MMALIWNGHPYQLVDSSVRYELYVESLRAGPVPSLGMNTPFERLLPTRNSLTRRIGRLNLTMAW